MKGALLVGAVAVVAASTATAGCAPWVVNGEVSTLADPRSQARVIERGSPEVSPVEDADVVCDGCSDAHARTDATGAFHLELGAPTAPKVLHVRANGYEPAEVEVPASRDGRGGPTTALTVVLRPLGVAAPATAPALPASKCGALIERVETSGAVVRVEALEHRSLGAVVGAADRVLVPFSVVEVDRPGTPIRVFDAEGRVHLGRIAAVDRGAGTAIVALDRGIAATPLELRREAAASSCYAAVARDAWSTMSSGPDPVHAWSWEEHATLPDETRLWYAAAGSPILDDEGRVAGVVRELAEGAVAAPARRELQAPRDGAHGRDFIFYGFMDEALELAPKGRAWLGGQGGVGVFYRDVLSLRVDFGLLLLPPSQSGACSEPPCADGLRLTLTPSIGPRIRLGEVFGSRLGSIVVTPSIGYALTWQNVDADSPGFDYEAPPLSLRAALGLAVQIGPAELATRWRIVPGDLGATTYGVTLGVVF